VHNAGSIATLMRLLNPFVLVLTAILGGVYAYLAWRLAAGPVGHAVLAVPLVLIWIVPVVYWGGRGTRGPADEAVQFASYVCMGWLNFVVVLSLARDLLFVATAWGGPLVAEHAYLRDTGAIWVIVGSFAMLGIGMLAALRGPGVRRVDIPFENLDPALDGVRIVQITDLHVGATIRAGYVRNVVRMANELKPDLVALTGDFVDGSVARLAQRVAPLVELKPAGRLFFVMGNHEYYSGAAQWIEHFTRLNFRVLLNEHAVITIRGARMVIGGVLDPAARSQGESHVPRPDLAAGAEEGPAFRLLLAHNPKLAPLGEKAGFDLQLSGHTHAGQFFPWTLAVRRIHGLYAFGLARAGKMWVYVSAGTGSWGPPVRFGTRTELTLIRLIRAV
jgi:predicted MPP superfamily phosphohydrolase